MPVRHSCLWVETDDRALFWLLNVAVTAQLSALAIALRVRSYLRVMRRPAFGTLDRVSRLELARHRDALFAGSLLESLEVAVRLVCIGKGKRGQCVVQGLALARITRNHRGIAGLGVR